MANILVCPQCQALNNVPPERLGQGPVCGKCRTKLTGAALDVSGATLARMVAKSALPVLVDFWAPWCGPCRTMAPAYKVAAEALEGRVVAVKLDTEAHPQAGAQHQVQAIPTMAVFKGGREVARQSGAMPPHAIVGWVEQVLGAG